MYNTVFLEQQNGKQNSFSKDLYAFISLYNVGTVKGNPYVILHDSFIFVWFFRKVGNGCIITALLCYFHSLSTFVNLAQGRAENVICQITILLATKSRKQEEGNHALEYWLLRKNKSQCNFAHYYLVLNKTKIYYHLWTSVLYMLRHAQSWSIWFVALHENKAYKNPCILTLMWKEVKKGRVSPTDSINSEFFNSGRHKGSEWMQTLNSC